jgi:hypothetical protein
LDLRNDDHLPGSALIGGEGKIPDMIFIAKFGFEGFGIYSRVPAERTFAEGSQNIKRDIKF